MMLSQWSSTLLAESSGGGFQSLLDVSPNDRLPIVIVTIVFVAGIIIATVAIIGGYVHTFNRHRYEADLKRELLDRGLSPEEVVRVVEASPGKNGGNNRPFA